MNYKQKIYEIHQLSGKIADPERELPAIETDVRALDHKTYSAQQSLKAAKEKVADNEIERERGKISNKAFEEDAAQVAHFEAEYRKAAVKFRDRTDELASIKQKIESLKQSRVEKIENVWDEEIEQWHEFLKEVASEGDGARSRFDELLQLGQSAGTHLVSKESAYPLPTLETIEKVIRNWQRNRYGAEEAKVS